MPTNTTISSTRQNNRTNIMTDSRKPSVSSERRTSSVASESGVARNMSAPPPAPEISHNVSPSSATTGSDKPPPMSNRGKRLVRSPSLPPSSPNVSGRQSFGGGNDGYGTPLFSNLQASKSKHMYEGYEDMKPKSSFVESAFRRWVGADHAKPGTASGDSVQR